MKQYRILLLSIMASAALLVSAVPAHPGKRVVRMADGSLREVVIRGDERCHWLETPEGLRLTPNQCDLPRLNPTDQQIRDVHARLKSRRQLDKSMLLDGCFPATGKRKLLAVLVNFADTKPTYSMSDFHAMMNAENYQGIGSFRDYYLQQSYGQLDITTTVTRWVTLPKAKMNYSGDYVTNLIHEALSQLDAEIDFRDYDNDGDGVLDGLIVIHQGGGKEATSDDADIWSHSSVIYGMQFDGVSIYRYTIEPELYIGRNAGQTWQSGIGVVCHEFGHNLGAPDFYDTDYGTREEWGGTGTYDIMGSGAWNGPRNYGEAPAPFTAWQKMQFGWMTATPLQGSQTISAIPPVATAPVCYQYETTVPGDYYILENRQPVTPWETYTYGHGLLITHAVESVIHERISSNTINAHYPQGFYTVCASAGMDPREDLTGSYGNVMGDRCTYGVYGYDTFSDQTLPSSRAYGGRYSYRSLSQIAEQADFSLSFDYTEHEAPQAPLNLVATVQGGDVVLTWNFPADKARPLHFTIYRDGEEIAQTSEFRYTDREATTTGLITYTVDASYPDGLLSSYAVATTRIPVNHATELTATPDGDELLLAWKQPTTLSRCNDNLKYNLLDHITSDLRYAHRYRPEDLLPYVGYKVRGISFIPNQPSAVASYKVCVWRATPGSREGELISSRSVSEFSPTYSRTVLLTTQPVIEAGYEYWVGVQITSTNQAAEVVVDQSELINGYGNWMSIGSTAWQADPMATGNYIITAQLQAPASVVEQELPSYGDFDANIDFYYPLAYRVYADGQLVTTTTSTSCRVQLPQAGAHTYGIVSLYKGDNESRPLTLSYGEADGISASAVLSPTHATTFDLQGRRLQHVAEQGLYIINSKKVIR